ncbi:HNH endonuclease [Psychrobacillus sp. L3]|uniref:HNH endonuclease n=1 Tax=Psychrobacillus sp. L3 TaxID=3236891 RepID=UPI0036F2C279
MLWETLYRDFIYFKKAFDHTINRLLIGLETGLIPIQDGPKETMGLLTEEIRQQVFNRDNYQCLCCGKEKRRGVALEIDQILPISMGGENVPSNLQALCKQCKGIKRVNEIDYRSIVSPLCFPKEMLLFDVTSSDSIENAIAMIVNHNYHCRAFCSLDGSQRSSGKNYKKWIINL